MSGRGHRSRMVLDVVERCSRVEGEMWDCKNGFEEVRSVPLDERIVTSTGEKEL